MRRKQTILRSAASATLALGVMFSLVQCNEATGGTDASSSSSSSVSTSRPDDDDDDDNSGGSSSTPTVDPTNPDTWQTGRNGLIVPAGASLDTIKKAIEQGFASIDLSQSGLTEVDLSGCTRLTSVTLPDSLETIGRGAFFGCTSLTSIDLPDSLKTIGDFAFYNCTSLTSIDLPGSLTSIGESAFSNTGLTSITLPDSLETIGRGAFFGCTSLTSIDLPDSLKTIGDFAFYNCTSLASIDLPGSLTSIGNSAFSGCASLASIDLPEGLTSIGPFTFFECTSLTQVKLPNHAGAFTIGLSAFYTSAQKELHLCIPNVGMTFDANSMGLFAFNNRTVTLYYKGSNEDDIKKAIEAAGATSVTIDSKHPFPGGSVQTGLSLFNLPF